MSYRFFVRLFFLSLIFLLTVSCSSKSGPVSCVTSFDCPGDQVCGEEGWCVDPSETDTDTVDRDTIDHDLVDTPVTDTDAPDGDHTDQVGDTDQADPLSTDEDTILPDEDTSEPDDDALLIDDDLLPSPCGNGLPDEGEECDDGNKNNEDNCRNDCSYNVCGDGTPLKTDGATLLLPLNEGSGTTVTDLSGKGNHGTINGAAWGEGRFGTGLGFAGINSVFVPEALSLKLGTAMTVSAWVKIATMPANYVAIIQKDGDSLRNYGLFITGSDQPASQGTVLFSLTSGTPGDWRSAVSATSIVDGAWHHVMGTYDGQHMRIYIDGFEQGAVAVDVVPADTDGGVFIGNGVNGAIDDIRVYDRVLDTVEMAEMSNKRIHIHLDELSGAAVLDSSGNGLDGTIMGVDRVAGRYRNGLSFNGVSGQMTVPHSDLLSIGASMTLSLWVRTAVIPTKWVRILGKSDSSCANRNYGIWIEPSTGNILFQIEATNWLHLLSDIAVTDEGWHQVVATYDGIAARIFIDGQLHAEQAYAEAPILSAGPLTIGGGCGEPPMNGGIDEVRIYNRALSIDEIAVLPLYTTQLCDDENTVDGDGCSATCSPEPL
ncbi:MAG TPA: hypothetical protein P5077_01645 [bacterium]|nr:hypothetical protein [bacterium]